VVDGVMISIMLKQLFWQDTKAVITRMSLYSCDQSPLLTSPRKKVVLVIMKRSRCGFAVSFKEINALIHHLMQ